MIISRWNDMDADHDQRVGNIVKIDNFINGFSSSTNKAKTKSGKPSTKIRKRIKRKVPVTSPKSRNVSDTYHEQRVEAIIIEEHEPQDFSSSRTPSGEARGGPTRVAEKYTPRTPFYVPPPPPWNEGVQRVRVQHPLSPARHLDNSAIYGIVITSVLFVILFVAIFAPWLVVYHQYDWDWNSYTRDYEGDYKWNSYDIKGEGYGKNSHDREFKDVFRLDSMGNGRIQAFVGIGLGILFGIGLIVVGAIQPRSIFGRRLIIFFRGGTSVLMLVASTFIMIGGSKFIGYSLCYSFNGDADNKEKMLCIVPYILFVVGILLFWLSFNLINDSFRRFRAMKRTKDPRLDAITIVYSKRLRWIAICLVILGMLALVTLPLLPIVYRDESGTDDEKASKYYLSTGVLLDEYVLDWSDWDFANHLDWINMMFWFIFPLAILSLVAALFLTSGLNDLTGYILGLVSTLICLPLITSIVFKILFIVDVYDDKYKYYESAGFKYGYNYLPILVIVGLVVLTILYMIHMIRGSSRYIRHMPRRYRPLPHEYDEYRKSHEYNGGNDRNPEHMTGWNQKNRISYHYPPPPPE